MRIVITAGPTIEPLDQVRRLTNFSTGRLGTELASAMAREGHAITLLLSEQAVHQGSLRSLDVARFTTTTSLQDALVKASREPVDAVFHAAAVSDFRFGKVWRKDEHGSLIPIEGGKLSTREGTLTAELLPTPKLIGGLRMLFPNAWLVGWKYAVDGGRQDVVAAAEAQIRTCETNACVVNGPAYGEGFGLVLKEQRLLHVADPETLAAELLRTRCR
jgi:phosphopantothenoylcysteine decarboxylase/phosphopantothenate--cysteine ligase